MGRIQIIADEDTTDPLGRGYDQMTPEEAAADWNTLYRPASNPTAIAEYCRLEKFRTGTIFGRTGILARNHPAFVWNGTELLWTLPTLPLGAGDALIVVSQKHIASALTLLEYLDPVALLTVTPGDGRFNAVLDDLSTGEGEVLGPGDKTAILAFLQNQQSRGTELGVGRVRAGDIEKARAL